MTTPHNVANADRYRAAWLMRMSGAKYREVAEEFGVSLERSRQIVAGADRRMERATQTYWDAVNDPIVYGVWHEFTAEHGRVSLRAKK